MRRRRLGMVAVAVSAIFCAASLAAWVTSQWRELRFELTRQRWTTPTRHEARSLELGAWDGRLGVRWGVIAGTEIFDETLRSANPLPTGWSWETAAAPIAQSEWRVYDIGPTGVAVPHSPWLSLWRSVDDGDVLPSCQTEVTVPLPAITIVTCVVPCVLLFRRWRRDRWGRAKRCRACGYNLRASLDRCPECGEVAPPRRAT